MRRRAAAAVLIILLVFCLSLPGLGAADICFVSLNDTLLELSYQAIAVRNTYYIPMSCFSTLGLYYSHFSDTNSAALYTAEKQIHFEMTSGNTYDLEGNYYSASAIYRGGVVYAPVSFVCAQFGLTWSFIAGEGYGDILRVCDSSVVLGNKEFLSAASSLMQSRYNQYFSTQSPSGSQPPASPPPTTDNGGRPESTVYLSFAGLPDAEMLSVLDDYDFKASFFLTSDDLYADQEAVRRLVGLGHTVGVFCAGDFKAAYDKVSDLIFEVCRVKTLLATSAPEDGEACAAVAAENAFVYADYAIDAWLGGEGVARASLVTSVLAFGPSEAHVLFACNANTAGILSDVFYYLSANNYSVIPIRETSFLS